MRVIFILYGISILICCGHPYGESSYERIGCLRQIVRLISYPIKLFSHRIIKQINKNYTTSVNVNKSTHVFRPDNVFSSQHSNFVSSLPINATVVLLLLFFTITFTDPITYLSLLLYTRSYVVPTRSSLDKK